MLLRVNKWLVIDPSDIVALAGRDIHLRGGHRIRVDNDTVENLITELQSQGLQDVQTMRKANYTGEVPGPVARRTRRHNAVDDDNDFSGGDVGNDSATTSTIGDTGATPAQQDNG